MDHAVPWGSRMFNMSSTTICVGMRGEYKSCTSIHIRLKDIYYTYIWGGEARCWIRTSSADGRTSDGGWGCRFPLKGGLQFLDSGWGVEARASRKTFARCSASPWPVLIIPNSTSPSIPTSPKERERMRRGGTSTALSGALRRPPARIATARVRIKTNPKHKYLFHIFIIFYSLVYVGSPI